MRELVRHDPEVLSVAQSYVGLGNTFRTRPGDHPNPKRERGLPRVARGIGKRPPLALRVCPVCHLVLNHAKFYDRATAAAKGHLGSDWPKSSSTFGAELRRIAPQLRVHGISIHFERRREGSIVNLSIESGKTGGSKPSIPDL